MQKKLRVAAYCRVSTDSDDQANSLNSQIKYFTEFINSHNDWSMCEIYYDEGISGTYIKKRKSFTRMMQDGLSGKIDLILTKEVSRFARNTIDTLSCTRRLKDVGVGVLFTIDNIDTRDSDGELRLTLMASIAQEESRKTSERVKWGQKRRMEQGVVFGCDLLGYNVRQGKLYINLEEADIVKLIYHKFLNENKGAYIIAKELNQQGIHPMKAKEWSNTVILKILKNEKYVGDLLQQKSYTPNYLTHEKKYNKNSEKMIYLKDHHEPIIDRITWTRTQAELQLRSTQKKTIKTNHSSRYWCSGKLQCGECGKTYVIRTKKLKNGQIYKAWRCLESATHGASKINNNGSSVGCNNKSINEKVLLYCIQYVIKHIEINRKTLVNEIIKEIKKVQKLDSSVDCAPLYKKIEELNNKKSKMIDLVIDETINKKDFKKQIDVYNTQIEKLRAKIHEANEVTNIHEKQIKELQDYVYEINNFVNLKTNSKLLYRELLDKIIIYKNHTLVIFFNFIPFGIKLNYKTFGKQNTYSVVIDAMEILDEQ